MSNNGSDISKRRAELVVQEQRLVSSIDHQSDELEQKLGKILKASAIVGAGFLAGYTLYKMMVSDKSSKSKNSRKGSLANSKFSTLIVTTIVNKGLPWLLDRIKNIEKNERQEKDAATKVG